MLRGARRCLLRSLTGSAAALASANYAIPASVINNGVGPMASANYRISSSLGDSFASATLSSTNYLTASGFWPQIKGVGPACILDLDGDGMIDPFTDGLMLLRVMFGLTGDAVTTGATATNAPRKTWALIQPLVRLGLLDIDGNGKTDPLTDGVVIIRALRGLTGTNATNNAVDPGGSRNNWTAIRNYLNATCGTAFSL